MAHFQSCFSLLFSVPNTFDPEGEYCNYFKIQSFLVDENEGM
jgi:hypothetical protein